MKRSLNDLKSEIRNPNFEIVLNQSGVALVTALLIMLVLSLLGTAAIMTTSTDVKIGANYNNSQETFYAADSGGQMGLNWLYDNHDLDYHPVNDPAAPNVPAVVNPADSTNHGYGSVTLPAGSASMEYRVVSLDPGANLPAGYTAIPRTKKTVGYSGKKGSAYSGSTNVYDYYYRIESSGTGQGNSTGQIRIIATYTGQN